LFPPYQSSVLNRWTIGLNVISLTRVGFEPNLSSLSLLSWDGAGNRTEVERAVLCAHRMRRVGREVAVFDYRPRCPASLITRRPRLLLQIFSPPLVHLSYRPMIGGRHRP
jgi:hypothetical protein